jgi:hypothetical protein
MLTEEEINQIIKNIPTGRLETMVDELHYFGVDVDHYEFGLPIHTERHYARMTLLVKQWLINVLEDYAKGE